MPISLQALTAAIKPTNTTLLLGAGASVPSGAPSGGDLAKGLWRKVAQSDAQSSDLVETGSILVRRYSRRVVTDAIVSQLEGLRPTGGLLGLPKLGWSKIFTTNFDCLLEKAYTKQKAPLTVIRSNYDFSNKETATGTRLFKIHGCITQDESFGDKSSMTLTESDYDSHQKYRQAMFASLKSALMEGNVLILGQSLRDRHLYDLVREVLESKQEGAPGHVYVLVYDKDDLRAPLLEDKGARIAFGGIDEFIHEMAVEAKNDVASEEDASADLLPNTLISTVHDVAIESTMPANVARMFNGGAARYADIRAGLTFERSRHNDLIERIRDGKDKVIAIVGAAGVGNYIRPPVVGTAMFGGIPNLGP
jgi:NAD-dependent SIR2 family protein deacetylase